MTMILLGTIVWLVALTALAYLMSLYNFCFTSGKEGAGKAVMMGGTFSHFLMWWQGHRLNDPRRWNFDNTKRPWEVIATRKSTSRPSQYAWWQLHWRWFELFGIYWYGLYPFKEIYVYLFKWTEQTTNEVNEVKPWHREEHTDFIFVKNFSYWIKLLAAEDLDNEPLDLDYLLTIHICNPYWALFRIDDWLGRSSADANNKAKIYVGSNTFDQIKRESVSNDRTMSEFAQRMMEINTNSLTEPGVRGTEAGYGVTINAISLVDANPAGVSSARIIESFSARIIAKRNAEAAIETAKGTAEATRELARGEADATRERAKGKAEAVKTVYTEVQSFGQTGLALRQIEAIEQTSASPNNNIIWANNPLDQVSKALRDGFGPRPAPSSELPSSTTPAS